MKKHLLLSIVLLVFTFSTQAQWHVGYNMHGRNANAVHIVSPTNALMAGGYLVNDSARLMQGSTDFGNWWYEFWGAARPWFRGMSFPSAQTGYVCGFRGQIFKTTDAGETWDSINEPLSVAARDFQAVHFVNNSIGYVVGGKEDSAQTIIKTTDGGNNWSIQRDTLGNWLRGVAFANIDTGIVVGKNGIVLRTVDAGNNWNAVALTGNLANRDYNGVCFLNNTTGFIVGGDTINQTLLKTTDGGASWNTIIDAAGPYLNALCFADATRGYAVGSGGTVLVTNNAGNSWSVETAITSITDTNSLYAVHFYNRSYGVVGGAWGKMLSYLDTTHYRNQDDSTLNAGSVGYDNGQLLGKVNPHGSTAQVMFAYSKSPSMTNSTIVGGSPSTVSGNAWTNATATITGLTPGTQYYYQIMSVSGVDTGYGGIQNFSTQIIAPPSDSTLYAVIIAPNTAELKGSITSNGYSAAAYFEYGTTNALGNTIVATPDTVNGSMVVSATISGLTPGGQYYFRVKASNLLGSFNGQIVSFVNTSPYPLDTTVNASNITISGAQLNAKVNANGSYASVSFEYGTSQALGNVIVATPDTVHGSNSQSASAILGGLISGTQYFFRVVAVNDGGTNYGQTISFYTTPLGPSDTTTVASMVNNSSAVLNGMVNANGISTTVIFEYGLTTSLGDSMVASPATITGNTWQPVSANLSGLQSNTIYYYRVKATNSDGTTYANTQQFYTGAPEIPNWDFENWNSYTAEVPTGWHGLGGVSKVPYGNGWAAKVQGMGGGNTFGLLVLGGFIGDGIFGGSPYTARPDSLIGYFNYDIAIGDTAMVGVFFKKNDSIQIAIQFIPFTGSSGGSFTRMALPINYSSPDAPDTMLVMILSSNILSDSRYPGNANSSLSVADLSFSGSAPAIPNGDFSQWETLTSTTLNSWDGSTLSYLGVHGSVEQTTDKYYGDYAVRMHTDLTIDQKQPSIHASTRLNNRHNSLNGFIKWFPVNGDTLVISLSMYKNGQTIGSSQLLIADSVTSYQPFTANISYQDPTMVPDSVYISVTLGYNDPPHGNSVLYIDHLAFDALGYTSIDEQGVNETNGGYLNVYPNPTTGKLNIEYLNPTDGATALRVYDVTGNVVYYKNETDTNPGKATKEIDVSGVAPGIYILNVVNTNGLFSKKIVIEN